MTEADLTRDVIRAAHALGWLCNHARPARTREGWRTPISGDAGYLDLTLCREATPERPGRFIVVELKVGRGRLTAQQEVWIRALRSAGQEVYVWRDDQWDEILEVLQR